MLVIDSVSCLYGSPISGRFFAEAGVLSSAEVYSVLSVLDSKAGGFCIRTIIGIGPRGGGSCRSSSVSFSRSN